MTSSNNKMKNIHPYASLKELAGGMMTLAEIISGLAEFELTEITQELADVNWVVQSQSIEAQIALAKSLLAPNIYAKLDDFGRRVKGVPFVFHRQQALAAMRLRLLGGTSGTRLISTADDFCRVGHLLLALSDHLVAMERDEDISRNLIAKPSNANLVMSHSFLMHNLPSSHAFIAQSFDLFAQHIPEALEAIGMPRDQWDKRLEALVGAPLLDILTVAIATHLMLFEIRSRATVTRPRLKWSELLKNLKWNDERKAVVMNAMSIGVDQLPQHSPSHESLPLRYDFALFKRFPVANDGDNAIVIDELFLTEFFGVTLLRLIADSMPIPSIQNEFGGVLGGAFERYVLERLHRAFPTAEGLTPRVTRLVGEGGKVADFIVDCGNVCQVVETKGILFTDHAVYGNNPTIYPQEIYRKLASADGVRQLATSAAAFLNEGTFKRIQPVLIVYDRNAEVLGVTATLETAFRAELLKRTGEDPRAAVSRLVVLSADGLDTILSCVAGGADFVDLIDCIIANDFQGLWPGRDTLLRSHYIKLSDGAFFEPSWDGLMAHYEETLSA